MLRRSTSGQKGKRRAERASRLLWVRRPLVTFSWSPLPPRAPASVYGSPCGGLCPPSHPPTWPGEARLAKGDSAAAPHAARRRKPPQDGDRGQPEPGRKRGEERRRCRLAQAVNGTKRVALPREEGRPRIGETCPRLREAWTAAAGQETELNAIVKRRSAVASAR